MLAIEFKSLRILIKQINLYTLTACVSLTIYKEIIKIIIVIGRENVINTPINCIKY